MEQLPLFQVFPMLWPAPEPLIRGWETVFCSACHDKLARGEPAVCGCVRTSTTTAGSR